MHSIIDWASPSTGATAYSTSRWSAHASESPRNVLHGSSLSWWSSEALNEHPNRKVIFEIDLGGLKLIDRIVICWGDDGGRPREPSCSFSVEVSREGILAGDAETLAIDSEAHQNRLRQQQLQQLMQDATAQESISEDNKDEVMPCPGFEMVFVRADEITPKIRFACHVVDFTTTTVHFDPPKQVRRIRIVLRKISPNWRNHAIHNVMALGSLSATPSELTRNQFVIPEKMIMTRHLSHLAGQSSRADLTHEEEEEEEGNERDDSTVDDSEDGGRWRGRRTRRRRASGKGRGLKERGRSRGRNRSKWNGGVGNGDEESGIDEATREAIRLERKVRRTD